MEAETPTSKKNNWVGYYISGFATALLIVGAVAGVYWYFQPSQGEERLSTLINPSSEDKQKLVEQTRDDPSLPTPTPPPPPIPVAEVRLILTEAVSSKDYTTLSEYAEEEIEVIIPATDCCGKLPMQNALAEMTYLDNALKPWVFDDSSQKVKSVRSQLKGFEKSIVGVSSNNFSVVFGLSDGNRIEKIRMSLEYGAGEI